ncbi:MAG: hypothetical protein LBH97_03435 [Treponema sp.]|nr:hypothetical protein [Treponema sp.]
MGNIRWGLIAGVIAFILSLVLGLVSGVNFTYIIVRALIFTAVFFGLGAGACALINNFIPELLVLNDNDASLPQGIFPGSGSQIDITLGDASDAGLPGAYEGLPEGSEAGNFSGPDTGSGGQGLDLEGSGGYNEGGAGIGAETQAGDSFGGGFTVESGDGASDGEMGELPDLGDMGGFLGDSYENRSETGTSYMPERMPASDKTYELEGDFNPKEIALGIRTVLSKDK